MFKGQRVKRVAVAREWDCVESGPLLATTPRAPTKQILLGGHENASSQKHSTINKVSNDSGNDGGNGDNKSNGGTMVKIVRKMMVALRQH